MSELKSLCDNQQTMASAAKAVFVFRRLRHG